MEEIKTPEEEAFVRLAETSSRLLPDKWEKAWKQFEERVRHRPGTYVLAALATGYLLQAVPFRRLLVLFGTLCLRLVRPVLLLAGAFKLVEYFQRCSLS
jgi:hypothetical protein